MYRDRLRDPVMADDGRTYDRSELCWCANPSCTQLHANRGLGNIACWGAGLAARPVVASPPPSGSGTGYQQGCLRCGVRSGLPLQVGEVTLKRCSGCTLGHAKYCSVTCQKEGWPTHKEECKANASVVKKADTAATAAAAASSLGNIVTWKALESLGGQQARGNWLAAQGSSYVGPALQATGSLLEVRIMSAPMRRRDPRFHTRSTVEAKDKEGNVGTIVFYSTSPPAGLAQGKVLRWHHPRFHYFMSGQTGARIEDEDIPNITISDV
mmetsp:Transcript_34443/g.86556  ORF Transcript_34443/g.86556 Transcript_34443/m.86556 type:complete len:268 (-) Transcript_34443:525-1328(-)